MEYNTIMPFPKKIMLEVTNYCNNKCIFCASQNSPRERGMIDYNFAISMLEKAYIGGAGSRISRNG